MKIFLFRFTSINYYYMDILKQRIALTWGDAGENHVGMEIIGNLQDSGTGFTYRDLQQMNNYLKEKHSLNTELVDLSLDTNNKANVLIIRNFIESVTQNDILNELNNCKWDNKYYDRRRKKVLNKRARYNLLFQHGISQESDFENGKGTIIDLDKLEILKNVESKLFNILQDALKNITTFTEWVPLICEGNNYYDIKKCYIGFHGDSERTRVICLSIGGKDYPMQWQWFKNSKNVSFPFTIKINSGDIYIMSEKAVGQDWKKRSLYTLRHGAGYKVMR